jgi:transcription-repair coupling factor (superfamily II helicase)
MNPLFFKNLYKSHLTTAEIIASLNDSLGKRLHIKGLSGSSPAFFFSALIEKSNRPLVIVLNDKEEAAYFYDDISLISNDHKVMFFPSSYKRLLKHGKIEQKIL